MDPQDGKLHKIPHEEFKEQWTGVLMLIMPDEDFQTGNEKVSIMSRLWFLLKPHKKVLTQALVGAALFTIIGLLTAIFVQLLLDHVIPDGNDNLLNLLGIGMVVLLILQIFIGATKTVFTLKTGQLIDARLILGYYKHLLKLPQRFFDTMRVGEIISRINDAVKNSNLYQRCGYKFDRKHLCGTLFVWSHVYVLLEIGTRDACGNSHLCTRIFNYK